MSTETKLNDHWVVELEEGSPPVLRDEHGKELRLHPDGVVELPWEWKIAMQEGKTCLQIMSGWTLELQQDGKWAIVNRDADGKLLYFQIIEGAYSPMIEEEPRKAITLGVNDYVGPDGTNIAPKGKVKGIICKSTAGLAGKLLYRANVTNFFGRDSGTVEDSGKFIEVGEARYRLYRLVAENNARIINYIGFYLPEDDHDGSPVEVLEVENIG